MVEYVYIYATQRSSLSTLSTMRTPLSFTSLSDAVDLEGLLERLLTKIVWFLVRPFGENLKPGPAS